jgi:hypothetical protein
MMILRRRSLRDRSVRQFGGKKSMEQLRIDRYAAAGWQVEEFSSHPASCFAHRGRDRVMIHVRPTNPFKPLPPGTGDSLYGRKN